MKTLYLVGLGRGDAGSLGVLEHEELTGVVTYLSHAAPPFLKERLQKKGLRLLNIEGAIQPPIQPPGLFSLQEARQKAVTLILETLQKEGSLAYVMPGKPVLLPGTINYLCQEANGGKFKLKIIESDDSADTLGQVMDFLNSRTKEFFPACGITFLDAYSLDQLREPTRCALVVAFISGGPLLLQARAELLRIFPPEQKVHTLQFNSSGELFLLNRCPLGEIEKNEGLHSWTFLCLAPSRYYALGDLLSLMGRLRSPEGCPWDRQQDHQTLKPYLIEEAYEVLEAIEEGDPHQLCEELGDLLLQVVFHSRIAEEQRNFNIWQVMEGITTKIRRRHPHVFGKGKAKNVEEVNLKWQEIKQLEKKAEGGRQKGRLAVPAGLPALMKAQEVQKRAARAGFDWPDIEGALEKIVEETKEFFNAYRAGEQQKTVEELGDLLFALVNAARFLGVEAEFALNSCIEKFRRRFQYIEEQVDLNGAAFSSFSVEELDHWWEEAKIKEKKGNF